jgi:PAS domain S-box-containing protein
MADKSKTREQVLAEVRELRQRLAALEQDQQQQLEMEQVLNEELKIANEELQVQAEELGVANEELEVQTEELQAQRDDLARLAANLEAQKLLLEAVLRQMPGAVVIAEAPTGRVILSNFQGHSLQGFHAGGQPYRPAEWPLARSLHLGEEVIDEEIRVAQDDGSHRILSVNSTPVLDHQGRIIAGVEIFFDVTERQRAEEQIRWLASFPQLNPNPVLEMDLSGAITYYNQAAITSLSEEGGGEVKPQDLLPADLGEILEAVSQGGESRFYREVRHKDKMFAEDIHYAGPFEVLRLYARDITERRRGEEALRRATEEWERTFDAVPDLIAILDDDHRIVRANRAMAQALGQEPVDLAGLKCYEHMHGASCPPSFCPHAKLLADGREHNAEVHELGRDFLVTASPLTDDQGKTIGSVHVARDITERKRAEEALQRANDELEERVAERTEDLEETVAQLEEEISDRQRAEAALATERKRLFAVLEHIPAHVSLIRPDHTYAYVNGEFVRRFGEPGKRHCYERLGSPGPCGECQAMAVFHTGKPVIREWTGPEDKVYRVFDYPFTDVDGSPLVLELGIDVTEARQAEEEIRQQAALLELAHDAIIVRDLDSRILFWNGGAEETYGFQKEEALNQATHSLLQTQSPIPLRDIDQALVQQGHWYGELVHTKADGTAIVAASRQVLQKTEEGGPSVILEINRDITARKEAEKKAENLGRLYRFLSRVNETIVRARDREGLYRDVCRVAVEEGRFRLAWVGLVDPDAQAIKVAAQFGFDEGYLENLVIPLADIPEGQGPTGTAVREGRLDVCHDYAAEPRMAPWREAALARGYHSSAAFPLRVASKVVGVLTLYAERPGFFNDEEIALLGALTEDLSFALESMDREDRRKQAEDIIKARLNLLKLAESHSFEELPQVTLDELEMLTGSTIGFYHLLEADQKTLSLQTWSSNTLRDMCTTEGKGRHYDIAEAGVWVDCVRQRRPVIHNDYAALPNRKGMPPGHAPVMRELVVPIFRGDKIVAIIGVGNKPSDYDKRDIEVLSTLGDIWWDIAERKRAVEEIAKLNEDLEQRVTERTAQLKAANKELEAFSYSVSHDLKAPIRAIEGFSRMLAAEHAARLDAEGLRLLEVICDNTRIMGHLIDDLLALSRLGRQPIRKSVINLGAMTRRIFGKLRDQEPDRGLQLTLGELPPALGDSSLLNQVMMNLLANAIKYTKSRETAVIAVEGRIEAQETVYYVKDNGVGFDERYADKLFGVFQRLHGSQEYEGTGVGLAIVKRIVERHGGRVWAAGKVNEGATFYFSLPQGPQSYSEPK